MSRADIARDEVRSLVDQLHRQGELDVDWYGLDSAVRSRLTSMAELDAEQGDDPYDAARAAVRKLDRRGSL